MATGKGKRRSAAADLARREREQAASQAERTARHGHESSPASEVLAEHAVDVAGQIDQHMRERYMGTEKVITSWADSYQPMQVEHDRARHSPTNHPEPSRVSTQLAMGHDVSAPRVVGSPAQHLEFQPSLRPERGADIASVAGCDGPLARSVESHQQLVMLNHHDAASPHLGQQLGDRKPMGATGAGRSMPEGTAGNYPGQATGPAPRPEVPRPAGHAIPAESRPWGNRDSARGFHPPAPVQAPGAEFTSRIPGSD